jgi:hypothetical protein
MIMNIVTKSRPLTLNISKPGYRCKLTMNNNQIYLGKGQNKAKYSHFEESPDIKSRSGPICISR